MWNNSIDYYKWLLDHTMTKANAPYVLGVPEIFMEDKMRFETVKIENESLNAIYGDIYTIKDNVDDDSPVNTFRFLKPTADKVCDWLNELVGEEVKPFDDKVKEAIDYLWDDDEYQYFVVDDMHIIIEFKDTSVGLGDVYNVLPDATIDCMDISPFKMVYFIKENR